MTTARDQNEERLAELLSEYIDREAEGTAPSVDDFLEAHQEFAERLRPLLATSRRVAQVARAMQPSGSADAAFNTVRGKLLGSAERAQLRQAVERGSAAIPIDQRQDLLLLLIRRANKVFGKTKLMKLLFLMGKETRAPDAVPNFFEHFAYNFGPFDDAVYRDVDGLKQHRLVEIQEPTPSSSGARQVDAIYSLSPNGKKYADALARWAEQNNPALLQELSAIVSKYGQLSTEDLIRYVYRTYPESAVNSKIRDEVLGGGEDEDDEQ